MRFQILHKRALELVKVSDKADIELISILQALDLTKGFRPLGFNSLYQYVVSGLGRSEGKACELLAIVSKSKEVPQLKVAIETGKLSTSQAKRITRILTAENKDVWIEKAARLPQKELERAVKTEFPEQAVREKVQYVSSNRSKLTCGLSENLRNKLERAKDLLSQQSKKAASLEETLEAALDLFIDKKDPLKKAERALSKPKSTFLRNVKVKQTKRIPTPALTKHTLMIRDNAQCTYIDKQGKRCQQKRWLETHHVRPVSQGGGNELENLKILCFNHHRAQHEMQI